MGSYLWGGVGVLEQEKVKAAGEKLEKLFSLYTPTNSPGVSEDYSRATCSSFKNSTSVDLFAFRGGLSITLAKCFLFPE